MAASTRNAIRRAGLIVGGIALAFACMFAAAAWVWLMSAAASVSNSQRVTAFLVIVTFGFGGLIVFMIGAFAWQLLKEGLGVEDETNPSG